MRPNPVKAALAAAAAALLLSSCAGSISDAYVIENDPGTVEHVDGSELSRVVLTEEAARRLAVATTEVAAHKRGRAVPAEAIFVDPDGHWWVYTNPEPNVYVRHEIDQPRVRNGTAVFEQGPAAGTKVVTVGVAELYGVEDAIGH